MQERSGIRRRREPWPVRWSRNAKVRVHPKPGGPQPTSETVKSTCPEWGSEPLNSGKTFWNGRMAHSLFPVAARLVPGVNGKPEFSVHFGHRALILDDDDFPSQTHRFFQVMQALHAKMALVPCERLSPQNKEA